MKRRLDKAVKDGDLTRKQADNILACFDGKECDTALPGGRGGPPGGGPPMGGTDGRTAWADRWGHPKGPHMSEPAVLVVDDEAAIREALERALRLEGFAVRTAAGGLEALGEIEREQPAIVLLDVTMPDLDGVEVIKRLRAEGSDLPICVLSARNEVDDRVRGLQAGADDYLVKPFALEELVARLHALLRRRPEAPAAADRGRPPPRPGTPHRAPRQRDLDLTRREFELLEAFVRHPGIVLSRGQLLEQVWGYDFEVDTNVVDVFVGYLRRKLEAEGEPRLIQTVRGVGLRSRGDEGHAQLPGAGGAGGRRRRGDRGDRGRRRPVRHRRARRAARPRPPSRGRGAERWPGRADRRAGTRRSARGWPSAPGSGSRRAASSAADRVVRVTRDGPYDERGRRPARRLPAPAAGRGAASRTVDLDGQSWRVYTADRSAWRSTPRCRSPPRSSRSSRAREGAAALTVLLGLAALALSGGLGWASAASRCGRSIACAAPPPGSGSDEDLSARVPERRGPGGDRRSRRVPQRHAGAARELERRDPQGARRQPPLRGRRRPRAADAADEPARERRLPGAQSRRAAR